MAPSTSSRTNRTLPRLAVQISVTVVASTGPPSTRCSSVSTAGSVEVVEIDAPRRGPGATAQSRPGGTRHVGSDRGDQEHEVGVDELTDAASPT